MYVHSHSYTFVNVSIDSPHGRNSPRQTTKLIDCSPSTGRPLLFPHSWSAGDVERPCRGACWVHLCESVKGDCMRARHDTRHAFRYKCSIFPRCELLYRAAYPRVNQGSSSASTMPRTLQPIVSHVELPRSWLGLIRAFFVSVAPVWRVGCDKPSIDRSRSWCCGVVRSVIPSVRSIVTNNRTVGSSQPPHARY